VTKYKKGFDGKKKAEEWANSEKKRLQGLQVGADKKTVKEFLSEWIEIKETKISPTTLSGYNVNINHINNFIGDTKIAELNLLDVQGMLDKLSKGYKRVIEKDGKKETKEIKPLKYRSVKYIYRTLHAALEYAVKAELMPKNVCKGAEIKEDDRKFEVSVYSSNDLKQLLLLLREQDHPLYLPVLLSSMRGLRRGECLGLRWSDVDLENGIAHIKNNYVIVDKKEYHKKVKTKDSERLINMDGFVAEELKSIKNKINKNGTIQTYVCEVNGSLPNPTHISRQLKLFQKANNLPLCRFHDLRHTFAVLQLEFGTDLDTLRRLLGHSKVGITSDIYLHNNTTLIKKASLNMDNIIKVDCTTIVPKTENE
jgi:integrase